MTANAPPVYEIAIIIVWYVFVAFTSPLSKSYARRIQRCHVYTLAQGFRYLRYNCAHRKVLT